MPKIKDSIECWLLKSSDGRHQVVLLRVGERQGKHPAFLQPVTGGIKAGETPEDACIREVKEETGVELKRTDLRRFPEAVEVVIDDDLTIRKTLFYANVSFEGVRINPHEHVGWELFDPLDVESKLYWQSNKDTWSRVGQLLKRTT